MARGKSWIDIQPILKDRQNFEFVKQLEKRAQALLRQVPYAAAQELYKSLMSGIPKNATYKDYAEALRVLEVGSKSKTTGAFAVYASSNARKVKKTRVANTVIYVRVKKRIDRPRPQVQLLEDMGPWTMDTIPFWPKSNEATVVKREDTVKNVTKIADMQKRQKGKVRRSMEKLGVRMPPKKGPGQINRKRNQKAVPGMAGAALRLEFGGGGERAHPLWRQGIKSVKGVMPQLSQRYKEIHDTWYNAKSMRWKKWPTTKSIGEGEAETLVDFQKKLGF
jgi:hypothetical protein